MHGGDAGPARSKGPEDREGKKSAPDDGVLAALRHSAFALVWAGALVSNVGNWIENVCQNWLVYDKSNSPELSGILQFAVTLPGVFLAIPMGLVADRVDRRRTFLWLQVALTVVAAVQAIAAHMGWIEPWMVISIAFAESIAAASMVPVWSSLLPDLVPRENIGGAIALSSFQFNVARVLGPFLAALIVGVWSVAIAFDVNVASFALVIFAVAIVRTRPREPAPPRAWRIEFAEAFKLSRQHRGLRRLILTGSLFLTLAAPLIPLLAALAKQQLDGNVKLYSRLLSAMGIGAVVGALLMGTISRFMSRRNVIALGTAYVGGTLVAAALSTSAWMSLVVLFLFGLGWCVTLTAQSTAIQLLVPDSIRGRIMSLNYFAMMLPSTLMHLCAGAAAERSLTHTLVALGVALFALALWNLVAPEPEIDGELITLEKDPALVLAPERPEGARPAIEAAHEPAVEA